MFLKVTKIRIMEKRNSAIWREMKFTNDCANFFSRKNVAQQKLKCMLFYAKICATIWQMETLNQVNIRVTKFWEITFENFDNSMDNNLNFAKCFIKSVSYISRISSVIQFVKTLVKILSLQNCLIYIFLVTKDSRS